MPDPADRDASDDLGGGAVERVEDRESDLDRLRVLSANGAEPQLRLDAVEVEVPSALVAGREPVAERSVRDDRFAGPRVQHDGLERGVLGVGVRREVGRGQELARHEAALLVLLEPDQEREVGVLLHVVDEESNALNGSNPLTTMPPIPSTA